MSAIKDEIAAMREVILLNEKVETAGHVLSSLSIELRDHDRRLVRLETRLDTYVEIAKSNRLESDT